MKVKSVSGKLIRLTDERWIHIVESHPEMAGSMSEVLLAIASPDVVIKGSEAELLAAVFKREDKLLVVVYREGLEDRFIITAFLTSKIEKILKRNILWQK